MECVIDVTGFPFGRSLTYKVFTLVDPGATGSLAGQVEVVRWRGASNAVSVPLSYDTAADRTVRRSKSFDVGIVRQSELAAGAGWQRSVPGSPLPRELRSQARREPRPSLTSRRLAAGELPRRDRARPAGFCRLSDRHAGEVHRRAARGSRPRSPAQVPLCPRDSQIGLALVNGKDTVPRLQPRTPPAVRRRCSASTTRASSSTSRPRCGRRTMGSTSSRRRRRARSRSRSSR